MLTGIIVHIPINHALDDLAEHGYHAPSTNTKCTSGPFIIDVKMVCFTEQMSH